MPKSNAAGPIRGCRRERNKSRWVYGPAIPQAPAPDPILFRNEAIAAIRAEGPLSDDHVKRLMAGVSEGIMHMLVMKKQSPDGYKQFIQEFSHKYCHR